MAGYSPFADTANDQMAICRNILRGELAFPAHVRDRDLRDVITRLLARDASKRLGCLRGGADDVRAHRFFASVDWPALRRRELVSPWKPRLASTLDTSCFDSYAEEATEAHAGLSRGSTESGGSDDWFKEF